MAGVLHASMPLFAVALNDPLILALVIGLVVALVWCRQLADQAKSLRTQNASLSRQVEGLKGRKSADDELLQAWAEKITVRLESLSPEDVARLDGELRAKLPQAMDALLAQPSPAFLSALRAKVEPHAEALLTAALKNGEGKLGQALLDRLQRAVINAEHPGWDSVLESLEEPLLERAAALAENPPPALAADIDTKIGTAIQEQVQRVVQSPDDYPEVAEAMQEILQGRMAGLAERLPAEATAQIDKKAVESLVAKVDEIFADPDQYADVLDSVNEALGNRIDAVAENPAGDLAARIDQRVGDRLVEAVNHLFENADYSELQEEVLDRLSQRIKQRLQEEAGRGSANGLDKALDEMLRGHLNRRFQQTDLGALDRAIDARLKAMLDLPPQEMLALLDRMFETRLLAQARDRLDNNIKQCEEDLQAALLQRLQARIRALPQAGSPAVDELIDLKLPAWFQDQLSESFQVSQAVARQVAFRVEGWIGSALEQPKPVLKSALENWITRQVLNALKSSPLGAETKHFE